ncbi:MAG: hypothetical protein IT363_09555 [Methanoregulaceae archaeon]|nr:hypothetical protein [Methanoregulaceae archaeon]
MTRTMLFALAATTTVAGTTYLYGQGTPVELQPTTPGTQQTGNANISGRIIASSVQAADSAPTAQVIVGNATGTTGANFGGFFRSDSVLGRALYGRASATSGTTHGVWGQSDSPGGRGVTGVAPSTTGNATGVWGQTASTTGRGIYGYTTSASGVNFGVLGHTSSPEGFGVFSQGNMHATGVISGNGSGLTGVNAATLGGLLPEAFLQAIPNPLTLNGNDSGHIIRGQNSSTTNGSSGLSGVSIGANGLIYGVRGESASNAGRGVQGVASAASGITYGVQGESASVSGRGVYGTATASSGITVGVYGASSSTTGRGVFGLAGEASGVNYGVFGQTSSAQGFGVFSQGNMHATGVISGDGSGLTNVDAAMLGGFLPSAYLKAIPNPLMLSGTQSGAIIQGTNASTVANAAGVQGLSSAGTGATYGVQGQSASTSGRGVFGRASATSGTNYGVYGLSDSTAGIAVFGFAPTTTGTNFGGYFRSDSTTGRGVYGYATAAGGENYGGYFRSDSSQGRGVFGHATALTGFSEGVRGISESTGGVGVRGFALAATGNTYGVYGSGQSSTSYGVYSHGTLGASGTKSFRIDHPFDPEGKYLLHYAAESPTPQNFYVGNVVTDARGYAWVELPEYFSEINANYKYQLTVVDDRDSSDFVMAKISKEIRNGRFQIRTSAPNTKVSWRIDADRNDLYVRNRPPKDVVEKVGHERGTYQHPEFYGFGPERGMNYRGEQKPQDPPATTRKR